MPKIAFLGTVFSGTGQGKRFVSLPWVQKQIKEKLGFSPYPGTLNLRLDKDSAQKRVLLDATDAIQVKPQAGYYPGALFKASIDAVECAVVVPKVPNYPSDVLEVIAPTCLRERLNLFDGSLVVVSVNV